MALANIFKQLLIGRAFTTEKGRIKMFGQMNWTLYPSRGLAHIFQEVGKRLGEDFLYKLGYANGILNAKEMLTYMRLTPKGGWVTQNAIIALLDFLGYGKVNFLLSKIKEDGQHHIIIHVTENPMIEHAAKLYGSKSMTCAFLRGLVTAHGELELGVRHGHLKENKCLTKGAPYCEWESKWVKE